MIYESMIYIPRFQITEYLNETDAAVHREELKTLSLYRKVPTEAGVMETHSYSIIPIY